MYILGINAFHGDSSACLIRDGVMLAAVEEERFRRVKHWAGFPNESINYCLESAGISLKDVNYIGINQNSSASIFKKIMYIFFHRPSLRMIIDKILKRKKRSNLLWLLNNAFPDNKFSGKIFGVEHHLSHIASAFYVSPYSEAVALSVDGFGDFCSAKWAQADGVNIKIGGSIFFPHSLGIFYQALTQFIGFTNYGDEYKVMGLAPYGEPKFMDQMRQIVLIQSDGTFRLNLDFFRHHNESIDHEWDNSSPVIECLYSEKLCALLGKPRLSSEEVLQHHKDIAASVQHMYEEALFELLNHLYRTYKLDNLVIAGGCAMNSVANGKIKQKTPFKNLYVQSAAGDAGGAVGAAYVLWHRYGGVRAQKKAVAHDHAYWGPSYSDSEIELAINTKINFELSDYLKHKHEDLNLLYSEVAKNIRDGLVVGWFQGRLEWGPRALGNRSILGDPRRTDMQSILNIKIKRRESFRPFAPSILEEEVINWFEQNAEVPFMMQVFKINKNKRYLIPAVTHVDGTGRLQTVNKKVNPRFYALISEFYKLTGVPMILNTSFNENEPIVCSPEEALDCFLRTKMDVLVMGSWVLRRT